MARRSNYQIKGSLYGTDEASHDPERAQGCTKEPNSREREPSASQVRDAHAYARRKLNKTICRGSTKEPLPNTKRRA